MISAVAECWVASDRKHMYASSDGLGQAFSFDILLCNFNADEYRSCIEHSLNAAKRGGESVTWVLSNHDVSLRLVGRTEILIFLPAPYLNLSLSTIDTAQIIRHATRFGLPDLPHTENHKEFMAGVNAWLVDRFQNPKVDLEIGLRKARAATLMILGLPGSTYIYQSVSHFLLTSLC